MNQEHRDTEDIQEMKVVRVRGVHQVSTELRVSKAVLDQEVLRDLGDTQEKREKWETSAWMELMVKRVKVGWQARQENVVTQGDGELKVLRDSLETKDKLASQEILELLVRTTLPGDQREIQAMLALLENQEKMANQELQEKQEKGVLMEEEERLDSLVPLGSLEQMGWQESLESLDREDLLDLEVHQGQWERQEILDQGVLEELLDLRERKVVEELWDARVSLGSLELREK